MASVARLSVIVWCFGLRSSRSYSIAYSSAPVRTMNATLFNDAIAVTLNQFGYCWLLRVVSPWVFRVGSQLMATLACRCHFVVGFRVAEAGRHSMPAGGRRRPGPANSRLRNGSLEFWSAGHLMGRPGPILCQGRLPGFEAFGVGRATVYHKMVPALWPPTDCRGNRGAVGFQTLWVLGSSHVSGI